MGNIDRALVLGVVVAFCVLEARAFPIEVVGRSGQQAPGTASGVAFSDLTGMPILDPNGNVISQWFLSGPGVASTNNSGVWAQTSSGLAMLLREDAPSPGAPTGVRFAAFRRMIATGPSEIAVHVDLRGSGVNASNSQALYRTGLSQTTYVARDNDVIPEFGDFRYANVNFNVSPTTDGNGTLGTGFGAVSNTQQSGVISSLYPRTGSRVDVVRPGDAVPGEPTGSTYVRGGRPSLSAGGQMSVVTEFRLPQGGSGYEVLVGSQGGELSTVLSSGVPAAGLPSGYVFREIHADQKSNRRGEVIGGGFVAANSGPSRAASYLASTTGASILAMEGGLVPGLSSLHLWGSNLTTGITANGTAIVHGQVIRPDGTFGSAVVVGRPGAMTLAFSTEAAVAGMPSGATIAEFRSSVQVNEMETFAFVAVMQGGGFDASNNVVLWAGSPSSGYSAVVRTGQLFEVAPGISKIISNIAFAKPINSAEGIALSGGDDGLAKAILADGTMAFGLRFTDGTYAVCRTVVPTPSTCVVALGAALAQATLRRRTAHTGDAMTSGAKHAT